MAELVKKEVRELRSLRDVVYAKLTEDNATTIAWGEVKSLFPIATISKTTETSSEQHYYDDYAAITMNIEGVDTVNLDGALLDKQTQADILGKGYDPATGLFSDCEAIAPYVALGYKYADNKGDEYYAWRYKGTFAIPDEKGKTKDEGTEGLGSSLVYTGVFAEHVFANGKGPNEKGRSKGNHVDVYKDLADVSTFFDQVTTCDTLKAKPIT